MEWVLGLLGLVAVLALAAAVVAPRVATRLVDRALQDVRSDVAAATGGQVTVLLSTSPLRTLRLVRDGRLPSGRLLVEGGRLPNGLDVRRAELLVSGTDSPGLLVAHVTPEAVSRQLGLPGVAVRASGERLRLAAGLASVGVQVTAVDGRVVLRVPVAPPPLGGLLSSGLTELVPRPPAGVHLDEVRVAGGEVVVRATVDLALLRDTEALLDG